MEYLGNKAGLGHEIVQIATRLIDPGTHVTDLFAGTASVSMAFAKAGFGVTANDILPLSTTWSRARLLGAQATFDGLTAVLGPLGRDPLKTVVASLRTLPGVDGWVTANYSPMSVETAGVARSYITTSNAQKIDAIRHQLREWRPLLTEVEYAVLMTSLLEAITAVSNIAGTYGCYLKKWKESALQPLTLLPFRDTAPTAGEHRVVTSDAEQLASSVTSDLAYADPPYTKRQYAAYYHLLNTIASDAEPTLSGSTGLPDWHPLASDWCYKRKASQALERLAANCAARILILSYSSDGHIPDEVIREVLGRYGIVRVYEFERRRYRSSRLEHKASTVFERIYVMQR